MLSKALEFILKTLEEEEMIKAFEQECDKIRFVFKIRTAQLVWHSG